MVLEVGHFGRKCFLKAFCVENEFRLCTEKSNIICRYLTRWETFCLYADFWWDVPMRLRYDIVYIR